MSTGYRRSYQNGSSDPPGWGMLIFLLGIMFVIIAAPAAIIGFAAQLATRRYKWSVPLWLVLTMVSFGLSYYQYRYNHLDTLIATCLAGYILSIKKHLLDITLYNWRALWAVTYPVWQKSWTLIGIAGCWQEIHYNLHPHNNAAKELKDQERRRQDKLQRGMQKARKRTRHPERLPDQIGGMMTMGIPIKDEEE